ncbi:hypothetical protein KW485_03130 [Enterobacter kobei]|nr:MULTISPECIES: hypothetical protein [Enterobacter cloacae complex]ELT5303990.1 hypothetical protein [Enterobacter roggenkampii]ESL75549.1 hypothetical protein L423_03226 [Enterobacter roggenkampii]MCS4605583.1 hypothetical protein [Enterobacter kobei]MDH2557150.1 hypothetical protein [Enterobacter roggenkampii]UER63568.1 hypothetical protein LMJ44_08880 [Enterobacter roggenkampii]
MTLKQSYQRSQVRSLKDFFPQNQKVKERVKSDDDNNFFTQLLKRAQ